MSLDGNAVRAGQNFIPIAEFPELLAVFVRCGPDTRPLEAEGLRLTAERFSDAEATRAFMRRVFRWGGRTGGRVRGNMEKHYQGSYSQICDHLREASVALSATHPNTQRAMMCVNRIKFLGSVSYASKHLRFMAPSACVTLDRLLAFQLNCGPRVEAFVRLSADCASIATEFSQSGLVPHPAGDRVWHAADVEAAIFTKLNPGVVTGSTCPS